jgi:hypothetical protein
MKNAPIAAAVVLALIAMFWINKVSKRVSVVESTVGITAPIPEPATTNAQNN